MTKHTVTIEVDTDRLSSYEDHYIAHLSHVSQANPLPWGTREAGELARAVGYEIIRRWLLEAPVELYAHQPCDECHKARIDALPTDGVALPAVPEPTDAQALTFHRALSDSAIGSDEVEDIKRGLRAVFDTFGVDTSRGGQQ